MALPNEALPALASRALELLGVDDTTEPYLALLREHLSSEPISSHGAAVSVRRVAERARTSKAAGADADQFLAIHKSLREREVHEVDRFTLLLQRLTEERALADMLRATSTQTTESVTRFGCRDSESDERAREAATSRCTEGGSSHSQSANTSMAPSIAASPRRMVAPTDASWLFSRRPLCGRHLEITTTREASSAYMSAPAFGMLPLHVQEASLVDDLLLALSGFNGSRICAQPVGKSAESSSSLTGATAMRFMLSDDADGAGPADPSLLGLAQKLLPTADRRACPIPVCTMSVPHSPGFGRPH